MKGKLYIFGIGGTGSRVLRSLVMLAASGVRIEADAIVPIIIDPDFANADLTRTNEIIKTYSSIRKKLSFNSSTSNTFFQTKIDNLVSDYRLSLNNTRNKKFNEFIEYSTLSKENKALAAMLFSENNLNADMEVGFKGNPNIGSVVLNQFTDSNDFVDFASTFKPGDRIFIISSIFGGTGASGFPLLLKTLRGLDNSVQNYHAIQKAPIGALTILPYFDIKPDETSSIDSSTFIGKTKAALQYYEKNVYGSRSSVNVMYGIGDDMHSQYDNNEGGAEQKNNAHLIEMVSALSIIDFASIPDEDEVLMCIDDPYGKSFAPSACFKEFGIEDDVKEVIFSNLKYETKSMLCKPLTQFLLFSKYVKYAIDNGLSRTWAIDSKIDDAFVKSSFMLNVKKLVDSYLVWLEELSNNSRSFKPYNLNKNGGDIFSVINGLEPSSIMELWAAGKKGYDLMDAALNRNSSIDKNYTLEQKFIELFCSTTAMLVEKKYKF